MKLFRAILFWSHLTAGLIAGVFIGIMCFTGTVIAFENEIVAWAERDARQVTPPATGATPLPLAELQTRLRAAQPEFRPTGAVLFNDPAAAIAFNAGRDATFFVNPYTGEARQPASTKTHDFMHVMIEWHRYLGRDDEQRPLGKLLNGIANLAFAGLAITGLYLWMPRTWSWKGVKSIALLNFRSVGKARDFNWHNSIGLWSAPILTVLTLTAVPISFRWGGDLIYRITGEEPPVLTGPGQSGAPTPEIKRPSPEARPLSYDAVLALVQPEFPHWEQITLRTVGIQRGPRPAATSAVGASAANSTPTRERAAGEARGGEGRAAPQPFTVIVRESGSWPRTATTTITLNPFTGEVLKREGYADLTAARQIRSWTRFLHTGEALGWPGQLVAGLACLGGCFLVYTGFALSWRRFFSRKTPASATSRNAVRAS
jgi:uncharacterized iron-regulated membrane protein